MHTLETVVVALAVLTFITYRQTRWVPVTLGKLLRMPIIFVAAALLQIPSTPQQLPVGWHLGVLDVVLIGVELALALVVGWVMGRLTEVAVVNGAVSSRLGRGGIAVWLGFIAVRIGLAFAGAAVHAPLAALSVVIFLVVAVIKVTQAVVVRHRLGSAPVEQSRPAPAPTAELSTEYPAAQGLWR